MGRQVGAVLLLDAPREELVARLNGRATAEHRADDTPEIIASLSDPTGATTVTSEASSKGRGGT